MLFVDVHDRWKFLKARPASNVLNALANFVIDVDPQAAQSESLGLSGLASGLQVTRWKPQTPCTQLTIAQSTQ